MFKKAAKNNESLLTNEKSPKAKVLVVLHLYYLDMWGYFAKKLESIGEYDLIVTIPKEKREEAPADIIRHNNTTIVYLNNRGRDILPFFLVARSIDLEKYSFILKLHSKKSPHYREGNAWLDNMVEALTSASQEVRKKQLFRDSAIVGPKGQYFSLRVNYEANGVAIDKSLRRFVSRGYQQQVTQLHRAEYGFFAGTMFWINPSYLQYLTAHIKTHSWLFEHETGQIDGTYAHALERIFGLAAEVKKFQICEIDQEGILSRLKYNEGIIPEWSDLA